jgi:ABC-type amino acid transport substrate-binding protein
MALAAAPAWAQDLPDLKRRGRLRVLAVFVPEGPQFVAPPRDPAPGFDREILEGFGRLHGLAVEVTPVPSWDGLAPALLAGRGDVIAGGFTDTAARRAVVDFTVEVFPTRDVVITRRPTPAILTLEQLRGARVGTIKGTSMAESLARAGVRQVDDSIPPGGVPRALREERFEAAVDGVEAALIASRNDPELQIGMFLGSAASLAYAVRKDSPLLRSALDDYLGNLRRTPTWNRLVVKYFGAAAPEILRRARSQ